jgi:hypothetical protein
MSSDQIIVNDHGSGLPWEPPAVSVLRLREAAKSSRSIRRPSESPEMSPVITRKPTGASDSGGKGYTEKPSGSSDWGAKNWPP